MIELTDGIILNYRVQLRHTYQTGFEPTLPIVEPRTYEDLLNLRVTDLLIGEMFVNCVDNKVWIRTGTQIIRIK